MGKNAEKYPPVLAEFFKAERGILASRLDAARAILRSHSGEMGATLESEARAFLRSFLPHEYGLGRGFVAWRRPCSKEDATWSWDEQNHFQLRVSPQLDIIIYDAVRGGPIADLGTAQLFPIEDVYGYVEVKAVFTDDLKKTLAVSKELRENETGIFAGRPDAFREGMDDTGWTVLNAMTAADEGRANRVLQGVLSRPRLSSWMIAFEYERSGEVDPDKPIYRTTEHVQSSFEKIWEEVGDDAQLSGALIVETRTAQGSGAAFLRSVPDHPNQLRFKAELHRGQAIGKFKEMLLTELAAFERRSVGLAVCYPGYWNE